MRREACAIWFAVLWFAVCGSSLKANVVYPLEIFAGDGQYYESPDLNLYVVVSDGGPDQVDFTFYNESLIDSSIARIYFDDGNRLLSGIADTAEGPGTSFSQLSKPPALPNGNVLDPPFVTTEGFSADSDPPLPKNGVNPDGWVQFTFNLKDNGTFEDVHHEMDTGALRIGAHVIGLPDNLSGPAIAVPGPGTLMVLGTAALWILTRKKQPA
jgi:hypothetical protein